MTPLLLVRGTEGGISDRPRSVRGAHVVGARRVGFAGGNREVRLPEPHSDPGRRAADLRLRRWLMALRWFLVAVTIVTVVGIVAIGGITITSIAGSPFFLTPLLAEVSLVFLPATTVVDAFLMIAVMHMMIIDTHRRGVRASSLLWSAVVTSRTGRTRCRRGFGAVRNLSLIHI